MMIMLSCCLAQNRRQWIWKFYISVLILMLFEFLFLRFVKLFRAWVVGNSSRFLLIVINLKKFDNFIIKAWKSCAIYSIQSSNISLNADETIEKQLKLFISWFWTELKLRFHPVSSRSSSREWFRNDANKTVINTSGENINICKKK